MVILGTTSTLESVSGRETPSSIKNKCLDLQRTHSFKVSHSQHPCCQIRSIWTDKTGCDTVSLQLTGKHTKMVLREKLQNHLDQTESEFHLKII